MLIKSICKTNVITTDKNSTLKDAAHLMRGYHIGSLVVTETYKGKQIPAGIITDRDIALSVSSSIDPQELFVENIMQSYPMTAKTSEGIFEIVNKMKDSGIKRVPVVNEDGSFKVRK